MNIYDVVSSGQVVYANENMDILITANGVYLNFWCSCGEGKYTNTDCRSFADSRLSNANMVQLKMLAKDYFYDVMDELNKEE